MIQEKSCWMLGIQSSLECDGEYVYIFFPLTFPSLVVVRPSPRSVSVPASCLSLLFSTSSSVDPSFLVF
jgi:hypothetical protein